MKILLLLLFLPCHTFAQTLLDVEHNAYRIDDKLEVKVMDYPSLDFHQKHLFIDLRELNMVSKKTLSIYSANKQEECMMKVLGGQRVYFKEKNGIIDIIGEETKLYDLSAEIPEDWLAFPMEIGDSLCGYFSEIGNYCQRIGVRKFGNYRTKWTGDDTIVLEDDDTLCYAHRLQTYRDFILCTFPIDSLKTETKFTEDSVRTIFNTVSDKYKEIICRWYVDGFRYPVFETYRFMPNGRMEGLTKSYSVYISPSTQDMLSDPENERIRINANLSNMENGEDNFLNETFKYTFEQSKETHSISINCKANFAGKVYLILASVNGVTFRQSQIEVMPNVSYRKEMNYTGLPFGEYVLYIDWNGEKYSEKFWVK